MKKFLTFMLLLFAAFVVVACDKEEETPHEHSFVNGVCECGEKEQVEHTHKYGEDGKCSCGAVDPNIGQTSCEHEYVDGVCTKCGEEDPEYPGDDECLEHDFLEGFCTKCNAEDPDFVAIPVETLDIVYEGATELVLDGVKVPLSIVLTPENTNQTTVKYTVSDNAIATVSATGEISFKAPGEVTITAESLRNPSVKDTITFTLTRPELEAIEIKGQSSIVNREGTSVDFGITTTPAYADPSVTWESSDEDVLKVDENGKVTPVGLGTATVTAVSTVNAELIATLDVTVFDAPSGDPIVVTDLSVSGETTLYYGYGAKLIATVYPINAQQGVTWTSLDPTKVIIDEDGYMEAIGLGTTRIKCTSIANPDIYVYHKVEVVEDPIEGTAVDMQGYKIVIMQASSAIGEIDPHHDDYKQSDKQAKKKAWDDVEEKYNCDLAVEAYPDTATWGTPRRTYITDNATNGTVPADLYTISSAWLAGFVDADAALDVLEYYEAWGKGQMEPGLFGAGSIQGGLYIANTGTSRTTNYVDHGLYYNYDEISNYGVEDPATMFNEGRWTYTNFENWAKELQTSLPENTYAIGGHPYYYWLGMTAAAGIKITDYETLEINVDSATSEEAMKLLNKLVVAGAMNPAADWAEGGGENAFHDKETLMTSGRFWFIHTDNRWYEGMWEEKVKPNIGYVPYPYPDNMDKEDTRVTTTGGTVYMFAKGRTYGDGFGAEEVYRVVTEMYLNTIIIQKTQPTFDAKAELRNALSSKLANEASVEAAMFYSAKRVFFDPTETVYSSTASSDFNAVMKNVVYNGEDYQNAVAAVKDKFKAIVDEQLG